MPQATRRWISNEVKSLHESDVLPFHEILDADMVKSALADEGVTFKERIYTPFVTLCVSLSQVLDPDHSCRAAVARLIVWLAINGRKPCSPETNSYSDARQRLPLGVIVGLVRRTAREIDAGASDDWLWKGRRVSLVDGTTVSMPDTEENQRAFPQANTQKAGIGFPVARLVAIISLATGGGPRPGDGPVQGEGDGRDGPLPHLAGGARGGRGRAGRPLFRLVFHARGADGAGRRRPAPDAPAPQVRLRPRPTARARRPRRHLDQAAASRMDGRRDLCSGSRSIGDPRTPIQGRSPRLPGQGGRAGDDDARRRRAHEGGPGGPL